MNGVVSWPGLRRLLLEGALLLPAVAAGAGLSRLTDAPGTARVLAPLVLCAVAGQLCAAVVRRAGAVVSALVGALAVALVCVWWFVPATTAWGLPTATSLRTIGHLLSSAVTITVHSSTPLDAVPSVVLCLAAGAGAVAIITRALAPAALLRAGRARLWWALVPSAGLFCYTALLNSGTDRALGTCIYLAAALLCVLAIDRLSEPSSRVATVSTRRRRPWAGGGAVAGSLTAALAVVAGVSPALAGLRVHAFPGAVADGALNGALLGSPGDGVSLVDDLSAVVGDLPKTVLFTVQSRVPTYWQVATLSSFDGSVWDPESATLVAADGITPSPSSLPQLTGPAATAPTFTSSVTVAKLRGTLVPVPPGAVAVRGGGMSVVRGIGVYAPSGLRPGTSYAAVSAAPASPSGAQRPAPSTLQLAPYLALPEVSADVVRLAHSVAGDIPDPEQRALKLAQFFDDGAFRYSLTTDNGDVAPLRTFLFGTHAGSCQQFAGAFAVMARLVGLPARVAVGFNAGTLVAPGHYAVTVADAHTWPQVYLGPGTGWVSFEPTPPSGSAVVASGVVYGQAPGTPSASTGGRIASSEFPIKHLDQSTAGVSPVLPSAAASGPGAVHGRASSAWWKGVALWVVLSIIVGMAVFLQRARLRDAVDDVRARRMAPAGQVVVGWQQATRALGRHGAGRDPAETMLEHAERLSGGTAPGASRYRELAHLASRALYSGEPVSSLDVRAARVLVSEVRRAQRRSAGKGNTQRRHLVAVDSGQRSRAP